MGTQTNEPTWDVLVNNGYRYEYLTSTQAATAPKAREWFKQKYRGDYRATDFRVRRSALCAGGAT